MKIMQKYKKRLSDLKMFMADFCHTGYNKKTHLMIKVDIFGQNVCDAYLLLQKKLGRKTADE
jgi:glutathione peroxidase-family protein